MSELKKYLFDNFVVEDDSQEPEAPEAEPIIEQPQETIIEESTLEDVPPPLSFSEDEMDEKTRQAEEQGYEKGFQTAQESLEAKSINLSAELNAKLEQIIKDNCTMRTQLENQFAQMSKLLIQKLIPPLQDEYASKIVSDFIKDNFDKIKDESKLAFYVHPDTVAPAQEIISSLANATDFEGKISIHKDESLGRSEARIEWENGGVECRTQPLVEKVTQLLDEQ